MAESSGRTSARPPRGGRAATGVCGQRGRRQGRPRPVSCECARGTGRSGGVRRGRGAPSGGSPFFRWPPTELADGFGREAALPVPDGCPGAGFTPVLRWVPGSPRRATRRRPPGLPGWGRVTGRTRPRYVPLCSRDNSKPSNCRVMLVADAPFDGTPARGPTDRTRDTAAPGDTPGVQQIPPRERDGFVQLVPVPPG